VKIPHMLLHETDEISFEHRFVLRTFFFVLSIINLLSSPDDTFSLFSFCRLYSYLHPASSLSVAYWAGPADGAARSGSLAQ
jgi:hypothetical protein